MKKVLGLIVVISIFGISNSVFADGQNAPLPKGEIIEIDSINEVIPGYPSLVLYGFNGCPYCVVEKRLLKSKIDRLQGRIHLYHVDIVKNSAFSDSKNPCGSGSYPQTQIFDKDAKQVACYNGFNKQGIIRTIWELTKINLEL